VGHRKEHLLKVTFQTYGIFRDVQLGIKSFLEAISLLPQVHQYPPILHLELQQQFLLKKQDLSNP
jgi:hypothetical protein